MVAEKNSSQGLFERFVPMLVIISVALAFLVGVLWQKVSNLEKGGQPTQVAQGGAAAPPATVDIETIKGIWDKNVVKFGKADSKVLFVEVGDPSCPYCHIAGGQNAELAAQVGSQFKYSSDGGSYLPPVTEMRKLIDEGKASYAHIYFPGHGNGEMANKALYCAFDQGTYWEAHDLIYSNKGYELVNNVVKNDKTKTKELVSFLGKSVDAAKLTECIDSGKYDKRLTEDQDLASGLGVSGTPGFFVNSNRFDGAYSYTDMKSVVDEALK